MKLIEVIHTIQLFCPADYGQGHKLDLCDAMGGSHCPLNLPLDKAVLMCEVCPMSEHATMPEEIWLATNSSNSSDQ